MGKKLYLHSKIVDKNVQNTMCLPKIVDTFFLLYFIYSIIKMLLKYKRYYSYYKFYKPNIKILFYYNTHIKLIAYQ